MFWNGSSDWFCFGIDNATIPSWKTLSIGSMAQKDHGDFAASVLFLKRRCLRVQFSMGVLSGLWHVSISTRWHAASLGMLWNHVVNHWWWWSIELKVHWVLWGFSVGYVWAAFCLLSGADSLNSKPHGDHGNCLSAVLVYLFCQILFPSPPLVFILLILFVWGDTIWFLLNSHICLEDFWKCQLGFFIFHGRLNT